MAGALVLYARPSGAQLSPGPLARAHKTLEGPTQCVQCHSLSRRPMATSCLECHKDVRALIAERTGYHGKLADGKRMECASCHPDHAGADFSLIEWPDGKQAAFAHRATGWELEGKHADAKCESCHKAEYRTAPVAKLSQRKTGTPWVGFDATCASCHRTDDVHRGELKGGCDKCHTADAWDEAPGFDHKTARFELTGRHADVECNLCHRTARVSIPGKQPGQRASLFRPVPFNSCADCHSDPHQRRIRGSCSGCHVATGWDDVKTSSFNHTATRYPLVGKHRTTSCEGCHGKGNAIATPGFATCAACHVDPHRGEAQKAMDCATCHTPRGFVPATFDVKAHGKTSYPLLGKHAQVECALCHTSASAEVRSSSIPSGRSVASGLYVKLKMPSSRCTDCHVDAHATQAAVANATGECATCHTVDGFAPSTITVARHATFKFALEGKHASATCRACHMGDTPPSTVPKHQSAFAFNVANSGCAGCHVDPHAGRYVPGGKQSQATCQACHNADAFRPSVLSAAEHARYGYALEGAHLAVGCAACHSELAAPQGKGTLKTNASGVPSLPFNQERGAQCAQCHQDVHAGEFNKRARGACETCHVVERFAGAARFDHGTQTRFALTGGHKDVPCARCHAYDASRDPLVPASARRRYTGIPIECQSCHTARSGEGKR